MEVCSDMGIQVTWKGLVVVKEEVSQMDQDHWRYCRWYGECTGGVYESASDMIVPVSSSSEPCSLSAKDSPVSILDRPK